MPSKRAQKLQQNNKKQEIFKSGIPEGVPLFYTRLSYKIEGKCVIIKYTPTCEPYNKGRNKKKFQNKRNKKKSDSKEPLPMFYVTKVSILIY